MNDANKILVSRIIYCLSFGKSQNVILLFLLQDSENVLPILH